MSPTMIRNLFIVLLCLHCSDVIAGPVVFSGHVDRGQFYQKELPDGLVFRLVPSVPENPSGWTIEIGPKDHGDVDFLWVVTPPYRFWNPRYIDVSYGMSAREAIGIDQRDFSFVTNDSDFQSAAHAVETLLWPYTHSRRDIEKAESHLQKVARRNGTLTILAARLDPPQGNDQIIQSFDFKVEIR